MTDDLTIAVPPELRRLADEIGVPVEALVARMIGRLLEVDADLRKAGLPGVAHWCRSREEAVAAVTGVAVEGATGDIRPSGFLWPADKPFPWTDAECAAVVRGYEVRWRGDMEDFVRLLPGRWEMTGGYAYLHQP